jgi:hypothetical protein
MFYGSAKRREMLSAHNQVVGPINGPGYTDFESLQPGNLWGSLTLQDRWFNNHTVLFSTVKQVQSNAHVEIRLLDSLEQWITSRKRGLTAAKVTVCIEQSPCSYCSGQLPQRTWDIARLMNDAGYFEFSFLFEKYYAKGEGNDTRNNLFVSPEEAQKCYSNDVYSWREDDGLQRLLLVRHRSQVKGSDGDRLPFKTAFRHAYGTA